MNNSRTTIEHGKVLENFSRIKWRTEQYRETWMECFLLVFEPGLLEGPVQVVLQFTEPLQAARLQGVL